MDPLERLSDREMNAPPPRVGVAVDDEPRNRVELIAEVEANRTDRRLVAQPRADGVAEIGEVEAPGIRPDVADVEEQHAAQLAAQRRAHFLAPRQHAVAAEREAVGERADLVASPAADAGRAAEK